MHYIEYFRFDPIINSELLRVLPNVWEQLFSLTIQAETKEQNKNENKA